MKRELNKLMIAMLFLAGFLFLMPATESTAQKWDAPAKYKTMKNPQKGKKDADGIGKALWAKHCASCHGKQGYGDGKKAANLDTELNDLTSKEVQGQTDGELYYKSIIGKDEMPNFEKKIPGMEDRWLLINYLRTLK